MKCFYISVEKNLDTFELYKALWAKQNISGIRVDTMTEGIKQAIEIEKSPTSELCFIAIAADDIDYLPQLKILSEETAAPILVATSNCCDDEHHTALNNGADFYGRYTHEPEKNIRAVLSVLNCIERRNNKSKAPSKIIIHHDVLIVDGYNKVFVQDKEIHLTSAEMKIFRYLILNRRRIVSHNQLHGQVKSHSPDEPSLHSVYSTMKRLRKKIHAATQCDYIETVRDFGYRLK